MRVTKKNFFPLLLEGLDDAAAHAEFVRSLDFWLGYRRIDRDLDALDSLEMANRYLDTVIYIQEKE